MKWPFLNSITKKSSICRTKTLNHHPIKVRRCCYLLISLSFLLDFIMSNGVDIHGGGEGQLPHLIFSTPHILILHILKYISFNLSLNAHPQIVKISSYGNLFYRRFKIACDNMMKRWLYSSIWVIFLPWRYKLLPFNLELLHHYKAWNIFKN